MIWLAKLLGLAVFAVIAGLLAWRGLDVWRANTAWSFLAATADSATGVFDPALVADLPEPAQRYFSFSIQPGARLSAVAVLELSGEIGLGDKASPNYGPMTARQILAPPAGLVWRIQSGAMSGSDAALPDTSWTRFWLFHLLPIVRVSGTEDHHRSAFGRVVSEAAFWTPAALLPSDHVSWQELGPNSARATLTMGEFSQSVDITVNEDGAPIEVVIDRWSDVNPEGVFQWQPFGGTLSDYREFDGIRVPTRVEGGNHFGTENYFPYYKADVTSVRFL